MSSPYKEIKRTLRILRISCLFLAYIGLLRYTCFRPCDKYYKLEIRRVECNGLAEVDGEIDGYNFVSIAAIALKVEILAPVCVTSQEYKYWSSSRCFWQTYTPLFVALILSPPRANRHRAYSHREGRN